MGYRWIIQCNTDETECGFDFEQEDQDTVVAIIRCAFLCAFMLETVIRVCAFRTLMKEKPGLLQLGVVILGIHIRRGPKISREGFISFVSLLLVDVAGVNVDPWCLTAFKALNSGLFVYRFLKRR